MLEQSTTRMRRAVRDRAELLGRLTLGRLSALGTKARWLRHVPSPGKRRGFPPPWTETRIDVPEQLRTVPGIWRDTEEELRADREEPLYSFPALHSRDFGTIIRHYTWRYTLPSLPRWHRVSTTIAELVAAQPAPPPPAADPQELTDEIRREADRLGLSQIGFAAFDAKYIFAESRNAKSVTGNVLHGGRAPDEGSVIVCILEQDWEKTQTIPSAKAEREVMRTYEGLVEKSAALARFLHAKGFRADVHGPAGMAVAIHFAVEAGLGQLGLNGQLLTPHAGSRCRINLITTNATLVHGAPVDYGIHRICDECQLCVRRCPPGAIPIKRSYHRGILKAKIKPERCLPILTQTSGCGICMKVCPVQRYGLDDVMTHWVETGEILGKGTDELEGYDFLDGCHYGPGQKPRMTHALLHPEGMQIDPTRKVPPGLAAPLDDEVLV
jgi:ferredoxin